jgi:hypothetical protein
MHGSVARCWRSPRSTDASREAEHFLDYRRELDNSVLHEASHGLKDLRLAACYARHAVDVRSKPIDGCVVW